MGIVATVEKVMTISGGVGRRASPRGRTLVVLLLLLLCVNCGGERPTGGQRTDDWPLRHVGTLFLMRMPRDIVYKPDPNFPKTQGTLNSTGLTINFAYGRDSFAPPVFRDRQVKIETTQIGERRVTLTSYEQTPAPKSGEGPSPFVLFAEFDDAGDDKSRLSFAAWCATATDRAIAERMFRSVRVLPQRSSWLPVPPPPKN